MDILKNKTTIALLVFLGVVIFINIIISRGHEPQMTDEEIVLQKISSSAQMEFDADHNQVIELRLTNMEQLPPEIGQLKMLRLLDLKSNPLTTLPAELGELTNLGMLDLSFTPLTKLPPEIGHLSNLNKLY